MSENEPEIIVSVVLEGYNKNGAPDRYAVNVARDIFDAWYDKKH